MKALLLTALLLPTLPALAQDYGVPVKHDAKPTRSFGAPFFDKPDSTRSPLGMIPSNKTAYIHSRKGPWYHIAYDGPNLYYALVSTLTIPGSPGHETAEPCAEANAVVVFTNDDVETAWQKAQQAALGKGFALAQANKDSHSFSTTPKAMERTMQLTVACLVQPAAEGRGSVVTYTGNYSMLVVYGSTLALNDATVSRPAVYQSGAYGKDKLAFITVDQIAHAYPGGSVKYGLR